MNDDTSQDPPSQILDREPPFQTELRPSETQVRRKEEVQHTVFMEEVISSKFEEQKNIISFIKLPPTDQQIQTELDDEIPDFNIISDADQIPELALIVFDKENPNSSLKICQKLFDGLLKSYKNDYGSIKQKLSASKLGKTKMFLAQSIFLMAEYENNDNLIIDKLSDKHRNSELNFIERLIEFSIQRDCQPIITIVITIVFTEENVSNATGMKEMIHLRCTKIKESKPFYKQVVFKTLCIKKVMVGGQAKKSKKKEFFTEILYPESDNEVFGELLRSKHVLI